MIRQTPEGGAIRVGDVARVIDGFEETELLARYNGKPVVLLNVQSTDTMQVVKSSESAKQWIADTQPTLPEGITLNMGFNTAEIYTSRMDLITESSLLGLLLVFLVLVMTTRRRSHFG